MMPERKTPLFFHCFRRIFLKKQCKEPPETVLRMAVEELLFPGFYGGQAAEDQDSAVFIIKRPERMDDVCVFHDKFSRFIITQFMRTVIRNRQKAVEFIFDF